MSRKIGALKTAAKKIGISVEEYITYLQKGQKYCYKCQSWQSLDNFNSDRSRSDKKSAKCQTCTRAKNPTYGKGKKLPASHRAKIAASLKEIYRKHPHPLKGRPSPKKGTPRSLEVRKTISRILRNSKNVLRGKDSPSYKDGKSSERRGERFSQAYKRWRYDVFARDNFTCQNCGDGKGGNLNAHHIKPFADHPSLRLELSNGVTLCKACHKKVHRS